MGGRCSPAERCAALSDDYDNFYSSQLQNRQQRRGLEYVDHGAKPPPASPGNHRGRHKEVYELGRLGALTPWVRCLVESIKSYFKLGALERVQLNLDAFYHDAHIDPLKM